MAEMRINKTTNKQISARANVLTLGRLELGLESLRRAGAACWMDWPMESADKSEREREREVWRVGRRNAQGKPQCWLALEEPRRRSALAKKFASQWPMEL